ncbi:MAG: alcohol dehydrogenase [Flavobacteriales bacterium]|nr:MAG: alcohol dehydrogenase [Flavobacteriales bacterium]
MKAITIVKHGAAEKAFEIRETAKPKPKPNEVLIKVDAFGLNYADVWARMGLYQDAPPLPAVVGYEVVGRIEETGSETNGLSIGQRVVAMTRFGGYAEYAVTDSRALAVIGDAAEAGEATALATQYCTAYYAAYEMVNLFEGDHVLIQAAAGGVGTALVQIAKNKGCIIYGTAGSDKKLEYLQRMGVDYPINYRKTDFKAEIEKISGKHCIDVVFDSLGGTTFKKGKQLLAHGGRIIGYGAAERDKGGIISGLKLLFGFGFFNPAFLLMNSKSIIGINMLRIADFKPETLKRCMEAVVKLYDEGIFKPHVGGRFKAEEIADAHNFLQSRKSVGKVVVEW